ncbi:MAG: hypothetical protein ACYC9I_04725 [Desulfuromonadales bacterium]
MHRPLHLLAVCFCAGLLGALLSGLLLCLAAKFGAFELAGLHFSPRLKPDWFYPRLVWGGLWGMVYFLAVGQANARGRWVRRGMWVSILPTAFELLVVFPYWSGHGLFGQQLGRLTPVLVFLANLTWGFFTGICCRLLWGRR